MRTPLGEIPDRLFRDMTMAEAHEYLVARARRPSRRGFLKGAVGAGAAVAAGPVLWRQAAGASSHAPEGLHVAFGADPTTEVAVAWSSAPSAAVSFRYGPTGQGLATVGELQSRAVLGVSDRVYHRAVLERLAPDTTYEYVVTHAGGEPSRGRFTTAPVTPRTFTFAALGDMGATADGATITGRIAAVEPDLVFFVGDLCYADRLGGGAEALFTTGPLPVQQDLTAWDKWLVQIAPSASRTPWMFTTGNHEMEVGQGPLGYDGFLARMHLPVSRKAAGPYYSFRYGNVGFVALDANDASYEITHNLGYTGGAQDAWLASTLARLRGDEAIDFIVVGFHHCMYCTNAVHASDGGPRARWGGLFDQYGVDLVINGHNHSYERTHPVRAGAIERGGTVYVTAGAGGQAAYPTALYPGSYVTEEGGLRVPESGDWSAVRYLGDHSVLIVDASPASAGSKARLDCRALAADDDPEAPGQPRVVDRFTIERGS